MKVLRGGCASRHEASLYYPVRRDRTTTLSCCFAARVSSGSTTSTISSTRDMPSSLRPEPAICTAILTAIMPMTGFTLNWKRGSPCRTP